MPHAFVQFGGPYGHATAPRVEINRFWRRKQWHKELHRHYQAMVEQPAAVHTTLQPIFLKHQQYHLRMVQRHENLKATELYESNQALFKRLVSVHQRRGKTVQVKQYENPKTASRLSEQQRVAAENEVFYNRLLKVPCHINDHSQRATASTSWEKHQQQHEVILQRLSQQPRNAFIPNYHKRIWSVKDKREEEEKQTDNTTTDDATAHSEAYRVSSSLLYPALDYVTKHQTRPHSHSHTHSHSHSHSRSHSHSTIHRHSSAAQTSHTTITTTTQSHSENNSRLPSATQKISQSVKTSMKGKQSPFAKKPQKVVNFTSEEF